MTHQVFLNERRCPRLSLITSVTVGSPDDIRKLHADTGMVFKHLELYAFMEWELREILSALGWVTIHPTADAIGLLSELPLDTEFLDAFAAQLIDRWQLPIIALSTFIPEITVHERARHAQERADKALKFLVALTSRLNLATSEPKPSRGMLELVAGSACDGLWQGRGALGETFVLNRIDQTAAITRFIKRLTPIATAALKANVVLAIELEPGPLFTVGQFDSLLRLCAMLEADPLLDRVVGLNLDIAHWGSLAGISPSQVRQHPEIAGRIVHAHISDHNIGHVVDAAPGTFHAATHFLPWLELLSELAPLTETRLGFDGFLSYEAECAHRFENIVLGLKTINQWLVNNCGGISS